MESTFLNIKLLIFLGSMVVVATILVSVLIAGVYQIVRDKVRESRRRDGFAEPSLDPTAVDPRHP